jgi:hypothetical protein
VTARSQTVIPHYLAVASLILAVAAGCGQGGRGGAGGASSGGGSGSGSGGEGGSGSGGGGGSNVVDLPGGIKRVTLTGNYVQSSSGSGWNLATSMFTSGEAGSDFHLSMAMVVSLFPTSSTMVAFCERTPPGGMARFARVEDVPSDVAACGTWAPAYLGGTTAHTQSIYDGQGFIVRDAAGVPRSKLLTVADSIIDADVSVTFDIVNL